MTINKYPNERFLTEETSGDECSFIISPMCGFYTTRLTLYFQCWHNLSIVDTDIEAVAEFVPDRTILSIIPSLI